MSIFFILLLLLCFCVIVWVARRYLDAPFGRYVVIAAAVLLVLALLYYSGVLPGLYTPIRVR